MQGLYRFFMGVCPLVLSSLFLSFFSCQSSDNIKVREGALVDSLNLIAHIGDVSSRMGMIDNYNGAFIYYWNNDKFNIYQKYVLNGSPQSMMPLEFDTSTTSGASAVFSYMGGEAYRYNPGLHLYAFSKGTSGGYTTNVADDGTSTLTAPTLTSQDGTLNDCAKYDALYGSAIVDYNTGLPESIAMHHLFGMLNLHITCSNFSTSYPVTVTLTSSAANILPGNGGNAILNADGSTLTRTGSWGTSWSATVTPTTSGVVDVYFMTWPFTSIYGILTISCSDGNPNYNYVDRVVTLSDFSLPAAQLKSRPLSIEHESKTSSAYSSLYNWNDVPSGCPNNIQICGYLSAECYWDDGNVPGGNTTSYQMKDGNYTRAGMWFRKGASGSTTSRGPSPLAKIDNVSSLNLRANYFFLPATGGTDWETGLYGQGGSAGVYWSSTSLDSSSSYNLYFNSSVASLNSSRCNSGFCSWQVQ